MRRSRWILVSGALAVGVGGPLVAPAGADPGIPGLPAACRDLVAVDVLHEHDQVSAPEEDADSNGLRVAFTTAAATCGGSVYRVRATTADGTTTTRTVAGAAGARGHRVDLGPIDDAVCIDVTAGISVLGVLLPSDRLPDRGCIEVTPGTGEPGPEQACADVTDGGGFAGPPVAGVNLFLAAPSCPGIVLVSRYAFQGSNFDGGTHRIDRYDVVALPAGSTVASAPELTSTAPEISWSGGTATRQALASGEVVLVLLDEAPDGGVLAPVREVAECPPGGCGGFRFK